MKEDFNIEEAKKLWNSPAPELSKSQISAAYEHLDGFIVKSRIRYLLRYGGIGLAVAACCLVVGFLAGRSRSETGRPFQSAEYVEYLSESGEIKDFTLPDGTHVYLNAESRLTCANLTDAPNRDVFLCGEAFFEVAKDSLHPFIVHAAGNNIKVTGTRFNVRAFLDESNSTTTLLEGGVDVYIPGQSNPVKLVSGRALSVGNDGQSVSLYKVDTETAIGWYKGEFNAYNMTLEQICRDLERRFGVNIMIPDNRIASKVFFASFVNGESVDDILKALNVHKDFKIKKQNKFYTIY